MDPSSLFLKSSYVATLAGVSCYILLLFFMKFFCETCRPVLAGCPYFTSSMSFIASVSSGSLEIPSYISSLVIRSILGRVLRMYFSNFFRFSLVSARISF